MAGKLIVVTGAATGIGRMTAELLARSGHKVYAGLRDITGENRDDATTINALSQRENISLWPIELDVTQQTSCNAAADHIISAQGRIDVVINNAAILVFGFTEAFDPEQFLSVYDTNAVSWIRVNKAFLPAMRRQGEGLLVYISSSTARMVDPFVGPYAASKAAADVLAETMHYENSQYGIETVIVMPGAYPSGTSLFKHAAHAADASVTAQYDLIADLPAELPARLNAMHEPNVRTDSAEVSEAIRDVIGLPRGDRPFRLVVDPQRRGLGELNILHAQLQRESFKRLGIDHLIDTASLGKT